MGHSHDNSQHEPPLRRLVTILRPDAGDVWTIAVFAIVISVLGLATPVAVEAMVNTVAFGRFVQPLLVLSLILLTFLGFGAAFRAMQAYVAEVIQRRLFARVVSNVAHRLPRLRQEGLDTEHGPEVVNRFFDVMTVQKAASSLVVDGIGIAIQTVTGMALLAVYHPFLLGFDLFLLAAMAVLVLLLGRGAVSSSIRESYAKYAVGHWLQQTAMIHTAFKADAGQLAFRRADELTTEYLLARKGHFRVLMRQVVFALALQAIAGTLLLGLGGWLVLQGQLTLGQLVAAELVVAVIVGSFAKLGKQMEAFYDLLAAVDKLGHLLDLPVEKETGAELPASTGGSLLRARGLAYTYAKQGKALVFPDFDLAAGEVIAVEGPPAAGKSTLLQICYALREPTHGFLEIDGIDLRELHPAAYRQQVAYVQRVELFTGTIAENVKLARTQVADEEVRRTLRAVGLWEEIMALPAGVDTMLNPAGAPLSETQSVRLVLARALVSRPRLLLIDGLLDQLPDALAVQLFSKLKELNAGMAVVLATERGALKELCSRSIDLGCVHGTTRS